MNWEFRYPLGERKWGIFNWEQKNNISGLTDEELQFSSFTGQLFPNTVEDNIFFTFQIWKKCKNIHN